MHFRGLNALVMNALRLILPRMALQECCKGKRPWHASRSCWRTRRCCTCLASASSSCTRPACSTYSCSRTWPRQTDPCSAQGRPLSNPKVEQAWAGCGGAPRRPWTVRCNGRAPPRPPFTSNRDRAPPPGWLAQCAPLLCMLRHNILCGGSFCSSSWRRHRRHSRCASTMHHAGSRIRSLTHSRP